MKPLGKQTPRPRNQTPFLPAMKPVDRFTKAVAQEQAKVDSVGGEKLQRLEVGRQALKAITTRQQLAAMRRAKPAGG